MSSSKGNLSVNRSVRFPHESVSDHTKMDIADSGLPRIADYLGIFLLSSGVLLFEITLTRIFSVILWSNLAFMVVSTALFGFGLSGVYLALRGESKLPVHILLSRCAALVAASNLLAYKIVNLVPFEMWKFGEHPEYLLSLALWEAALVLPFFFAGLAVATLLGRYPVRASRLYGIDLLGAALGTILLVPLITPLGGEGLIVLSSILTLAAALCFSLPEQRVLRGTALLAFLLLGATLRDAAHYFPLSFHSHKRGFASDLDRQPIFETRWSALSRVDIGSDQKRSGPLRSSDTLALWIDGGTNASVMLKWDGKLESTSPQNWLNIGVAYPVAPEHPKVLVIGSAGGREVYFALSHGASHIDAVEMDPSTVHFVRDPQYASFIGDLYSHPKVNLVNDEGRAYLSRQPDETYDVIQSVNNYTPVAMASGALNLSETFLFTKEAFQEYFDHLTPNGILSLHRGAALRVALTAAAALRDRGIEHPENHIVIANGDYEANQVILIKKSEWTEQEITRIHSFLESLHHYGSQIFLWAPKGAHHLDPFYANVLRADGPGQQFYAHGLGLNLSPTTDDNPFLEHFIQFGSERLLPGAPPEFHRRNREKWLGVVPRGDFPYVAVLLESVALATIFLGLPLLIQARGTRRSARHLEGFFGFLGFFAALGFGFIAIEICLMKRYVLFLGHPAYSISTVILVLLLGAGVGSLMCERFVARIPQKALTVAILSLVAALLFESVCSPYVFEFFLSSSLSVRIAIAASLLFPLGVLMGMPFTLGIALIRGMHPTPEEHRQLIAWAWAINGYTTVIGSALTVYIALFFGFRTALLVAGVVYALGLGALLVAVRRPRQPMALQLVQSRH